MNNYIKIGIATTFISVLSGCNVTTEITDTAGNKNIGGSIKSTDGYINCPDNTCAYEYSGFDQEVTLQATADNGYVFTGYRNAATICTNGKEANKTGTCNLIASTPVLVVGVFCESFNGECSDDPNDFDGDTIPNDSDNCPSIENFNQEDYDHDGKGDACDTDDDNDQSLDADDCEPFNEFIHPNAIEIPDGIDNNCNDQIDENTELKAPNDIKKIDSGCCHTWGEFEWTSIPFVDAYEINLEGYFGGGCLTDHSNIIEFDHGNNPTPMKLTGKVTSAFLCLGTKYKVTIRARRGNQWSEWSEEVKLRL